MANYATNIFFASTENENDLNKIEQYLNDTFGSCYLDRWEDCIEGEFESRWDYPEHLMNTLFEQLEDKDSLYCRVLTHELANEEIGEQESIVGCPCTLLNDYKGYTDGVVLMDFGNELVIQLTSGKEIVESRDDVLVMA